MGFDYIYFGCYPVRSLGNSIQDNIYVGIRGDQKFTAFNWKFSNCTLIECAAVKYHGRHSLSTLLITIVTYRYLVLC